ncbi:MAG: tetratricopeptide repeat protein [bacterium]
MFGFLFGGKKTSQPMEVDASPDVVDLYNKGTIASSKGQYEKAIQLLTLAVEKDPRFAPAYINRGNAYNKLTTPKADTAFYDEQLAKAISDYSKAIEIDPSNGQTYYLRGVSSYVKGDYKQSYVDIQKARSLGHTDIDLRIEQAVSRSVNPQQ